MQIKDGPFTAVLDEDLAEAETLNSTSETTTPEIFNVITSTITKACEMCPELVRILIFVPTGRSCYIYFILQSCLNGRLM